MSVRGPYMNDDGDWWVAVEDATFREARNEIVSCLSYDIPEDGTLRYVGKSRTNLCDSPAGEHEVGPSCSAECQRDVMAWHFVENRRW